MSADREQLYAGDMLECAVTASMSPNLRQEMEAGHTLLQIHPMVVKSTHDCKGPWFIYEQILTQGLLCAEL